MEAVDLGILPVSTGEPIVVAGLVQGGAYVRGPDADWTLWSLDALLSAPPGEGPGAPAVPYATPLDEPSPPAPPPPGGLDPSGPPRSSCASPSTRSVTPDPRNGPPTTYDVCPP